MIPIVVPARGGSKRIPRKNIHPFAGRPLMAWTIEAAIGSDLGPCLVSTEDAEIASVAIQWGARVIERPVDLATDLTSTEAVVLHVLDVLMAGGEVFDWVMVLQPTSPFRSAKIVREVAALLSSDQPADCLMTVTESKADYWQGKPAERLTRLFPNAPRRQQAREPLYEENSAVYLCRVSALRETGSILGRHVVGIPTSPLEGFDINTDWDMRVAEALYVAMVAK